MRHLLFMILALLNIAFAQTQFVLTPDGFKTEKGQSFYVMESPGKSQKQLYDLILNWMENQYEPYARISELPSESILIQVDLPKMVNYFNEFYNVAFNVTLEFKDGRIKVNAPEIKNIYSYSWRKDSLKSTILIKPPYKTDRFSQRLGIQFQKQA